MRSTALGVAVCLLAHHLANAKTASAPGRDHEEFPYQASVSEVSKDGHPIHNRLTFNCEPADGSSGRPPKEIDCIMVQQDLQEPEPLSSREVLEKQVKEMTDGDKLKEVCQAELARRSKDGSQQEAELGKKIAKACNQPNRAAVVAALTDIFRDVGEAASHTCAMMTVVQKFTFSYVKKGIWVSHPDPMRACSNVAVTRTLRADLSTPSNWNYTEVTVATPSKDSLCHAESGTTEFTWRQAFTASRLNCSYVEM
jgi:hypothetical protein